jgi:hypothetical protein
MEFYTRNQRTFGDLSKLKYVSYVRRGLRSEDYILFKK